MMNLYSIHAHEFSQTRQSPWFGWNKILKYKIINPQSKILDIGCGNGRFLKFLIDNNIQFESYIGIDNSDELLKIADYQFPNTNSQISFLNIDVEDETWGEQFQETEFELIIAFGLLHHIRTFKQREQLFQTIEQLLSQDGVAVVTLWQFLLYSRFTSKIKKELGENDFEMSFGKKGATRFVHFTSDTELQNILNSTNLEVIEDFLADGDNNKLNRYVVLKKNKKN